MSTLNYSITINSSPERVRQNLWSDESYPQWTAPFMEGSYAESSWDEGAKIAFLTPSNNGMFGIIQKKVVNKEMTFKHLGEIKNGIEEKKDWKNATESYKLSEIPEGTMVLVVLTVDDANEQFESYFNEAFPNALATLKQLCES